MILFNNIDYKPTCELNLNLDLGDFKLPRKKFAPILLCLSAITAYAKDGLYLHLPLNEGSGTSKDVSNNKFKTEMSKAVPKWADGGHAKVKKALEFDGKTSSVKIDMEGQGKDINSHYDPAKGLSICAWVKVIETATDKHSQTRQPIVMKGAGGQWESALLVYDDLKVGMSVWTCPGSGASEPNGGKTWNWVALSMRNIQDQGRCQSLS